MHCLGRQTLQLCADRNCVPTISCRTAQLLTVQELVALGQGVSLVPEMAASRTATGAASIGRSTARRSNAKSA